MLPDPVLELHDATGAVVATNDDWADNYNRQEIIDTGIAPVSSKESVILARLPSNASGVAYTAILRDAARTREWDWWKCMTWTQVGSLRGS